MSTLFSSPKYPAAVSPPPAPVAGSADVQSAAQQEATAQAQAAGRASTILTSGQGDTSQANVARKTLLGG